MHSRGLRLTIRHGSDWCDGHSLNLAIADLRDGSHGGSLGLPVHDLADWHHHHGVHATLDLPCLACQTYSVREKVGATYHR